ncbi:hypothetical protein F6X40_10940 [Paraburkholderia sp. UCT31]|uniref:hypothetical protein n=1 Tax=Paraburkholderia sp. UCT31 TaxID=2615209 RepID=UPI00165677B4|nr:hypothetical protein [Paraburkholderia sp. UCT31]MBC8737323.1 hypothetical protein [Paraburkholderia sp. UCT31]
MSKKKSKSVGFVSEKAITEFGKACHAGSHKILALALLAIPGLPATCLAYLHVPVDVEGPTTWTTFWGFFAVGCILKVIELATMCNWTSLKFKK